MISSVVEMATRWNGSNGALLYVKSHGEGTEGVVTQSMARYISIYIL